VIVYRVDMIGRPGVDRGPQPGGEEPRMIIYIEGYAYAKYDTDKWFRESRGYYERWNPDMVELYKRKEN